jgi:hypothetical protein
MVYWYLVYGSWIIDQGFRVESIWLWILDFRFLVFGFRFLFSGLRVSGLEYRVSHLWFRVENSRNYSF